MKNLTIKRGMPSMITRDDNGTVLVLELIRRDINNKIALLKPRMAISVTIAKYIVKLAISLIFKILCKQQGCITARPIGEVLEGDIECFRITLHNCPPKDGGKLVQFGFISVCRTTGEIFITKTHPIRHEYITLKLSGGCKPSAGLFCYKCLICFFKRFYKCFIKKLIIKIFYFANFNFKSYLLVTL